MSLAEPEAMTDLVERRSAAGIHQFQVKVGDEPVEEAARVQAVLGVADPSAVTIADANGGWCFQDAVLATHFFQEFPIFLEQPCEVMAECVAFRSLTHLPLVLDEAVLKPEDAVTAKPQAGADSININLGRVDGLTPGRLLWDVAMSLGLTVSIHNTGGGAVTKATVSHLAASTPKPSLPKASFFNGWTNEHVATPRPVFAGGRGSPPLGGGLGIVVEESSLGGSLFTVVLN